VSSSCSCMLQQGAFKRHNLKVQINTTDDTICMKYLRISPNTKLEGFILGYGSSFFSNQYIPLPSEGKSYATEVDAEPRYLITVRPVPIPSHKKTCSGKTKTQKPLQLVIGTLTPTSVFLSWGILVNPQHDWTARSSCTSDRFYTVRYREKDKNKKWGFQLCPATETVVDSLKPNTLYEFGVKDNTEDGIWSKVFNHKTILSVATLPDRQRPPIASAKPTQVRRKPLPPNTVTGKPGNPGASAFSFSVLMLWVTVMCSVAITTVDIHGTYCILLSYLTLNGDAFFLAPHVKYLSKPENKPCSITDTLQYFPEEEGSNQEDLTSPPQNPPSNLTVVTVEGCPSFVVLNWTKPDNDTITEYEVVSTENGAPRGKEISILTTNQTHSTVENLKPNTSYEFHVKPKNPLGEGPSSIPVSFNTESADPRVSESISMGKDAIWTEIPFNSDPFSECRGKQYVKRTWYKKFVGVQLCNSLRYKIYLSDSLTGKFYNIGDQRGYGEDHCQFVDSFLDGRTGQQVFSEQLPTKEGFFRAVRQEPVKFGKIGGHTHITYVHWYECGTSIPGQW
uniref:ABI family member 3 binding protein n=1 Tax=Pelusios castaneus TaxID=367368 RepID=A0A8C8RCM8_9SAUR